MAMPAQTPAGRSAHGVELFRQHFPLPLPEVFGHESDLSTERSPHHQDLDLIYTNFRGMPQGEWHGSRRISTASEPAALYGVCAKSNSWNNGNARHWASVNLGDPVL